MMSKLQIQQRFTKRINEHVNQCQICQSGLLCDIAERIINETEALKEQEKRAKQEQKLKEANLVKE